MDIDWKELNEGISEELRKTASQPLPVLQTAANLAAPVMPWLKAPIIAT